MEVRNQLLRLGNPVVAEISEPSGEQRVWLWMGRVGRAIEVRRVEQSRAVDPEEWSDPIHDLQVIERESYADLDAALAALNLRGVDTDAFDATWKSPNPF